MFATLDPKLRQLTLPSRRKVLLSDTVGFLRDLPHSLVTSFRATLEEVERAELLLHVRDAASVTLDEQRAQVEAVLEEIGRGWQADTAGAKQNRSAAGGNCVCGGRIAGFGQDGAGAWGVTGDH